MELLLDDYTTGGHALDGAPTWKKVGESGSSFMFVMHLWSEQELFRKPIVQRIETLLPHTISLFLLKWAHLSCSVQ